jgi:hypothetical protein
VELDNAECTPRLWPSHCYSSLCLLPRWYPSSSRAPAPTLLPTPCSSSHIHKEYEQWLAFNASPEPNKQSRTKAYKSTAKTAEDEAATEKGVYKGEMQVDRAAATDGGEGDGLEEKQAGEGGIAM